MIEVDLHIHSCLSPCASLEMSPQAIIEGASAAGLGMIALCDHNSAANCAVVARLGSERGIVVLCGMEVTTREEAHILTIFESPAAAEDFGSFIYSHLPDIANDPLRFGDQVIVDEWDEITGEVDKYLGMATDLSVEDLFEAAVQRGALVIPSHIDRPYAGLLAQLGFIPDIPFHAVEIAFERNLSLAEGFTAVASSDAHIPDLIGTKKSILKGSFENARLSFLAEKLARGDLALVYP